MFWYCGQLLEKSSLELSIDDPALLYGANVFTTLRIYDNSLDHPLTHWVGHCDRLQTALKAFHWREPNWEQIQQGVQTVLSTFPVVRITLFPDGRELITGRHLPPDLAQRQQQGIVAWLANAPDFKRSLPHHKTGNYLSAWLALSQGQQHNAQEAILIDAEGNWLETSTGNLWGWREGHWWTPPLSAGILPGIMRSQLIQWLLSHNKTISETPWTPKLVEEFEAIAYSNSVAQVVPIHTVLQPSSQLAYNPYHEGFKQLRGLFPPEWGYNCENALT